MAKIAQGIVKRKVDHLKIATSEISQLNSPGFDNYRFVHIALPEIDFDEIDTTTTFLGKKINYPFIISCMTGGILEGKKINKNLASTAQKYRIPFGVGSQRVAIEKPELEDLFRVRNYAPDVPIMANVGLVQLNYGFGLKEYQKCIDMIEADALAVHINPIQEIIQPEGDRNWKGLLDKLAKIVDKLRVPVIAKEVGFGLSGEVVERLHKIGVNIFDTAGWGGTNWALVEGFRGKADRELGILFSQWGVPTTDSIKMCAEYNRSLVKQKKKPVTILGSGGVRNGIDIAKTLTLGADLAGIASPFAKAALASQEEVERLIERYALELKVAMFGTNSKKITDLKNLKFIEN